MRRREEIQISGYYRNLTERGFNVSLGWDKDFEKQQAIRPNEDELVYSLVRTATLAGIIRFTPLERISGTGYLFDEQMDGEFVHQRSLALLFGQTALLDFEMSQVYDGDLELETNRDDRDSIRTYEELGFAQTRPLGPEDTHMTMLRPGIVYRHSRIVRRQDEEL